MKGNFSFCLTLKNPGVKSNICKITGKKPEMGVQGGAVHRDIAGLFGEESWVHVTVSSP